MTIYLKMLFYNKHGDAMTIYLDYVFFINFFMDFILLLSVSMILRRNVKILSLIKGAFLGSISLITLFLNINSIELFIFKIVVSILMTLITFGYKNIKYTLKNVLYLYLNSIMLGGLLYFLNNQFSYKEEGLVFYNNGFSINLTIILISTPILMYFYIKQLYDLKNNYSVYYKVDIKYKDKIIKLNGFLDTGNKLFDPITKKPIIIATKKSFKKIDKYSLVSYSTISGSSIIKCIVPDEVYINKKKINKKIKIGLVDKINMEGIGCILNPIIIGD